MGGGTNAVNEVLYICRATEGGNLIPGKTKGAACHISHGGLEKKVDTYDVLVKTSNTITLDWEDESNGNAGDLAVPGGYNCGCNGKTGQILYIGKTAGIISPDGN